jgi:hypothetical protein
MQTSMMGNTAFTTYNPGTVNRLIKPGQDTYIRVLTVPPGAHRHPAGHHLAESIMENEKRSKSGKA